MAAASASHTAASAITMDAPEVQAFLKGQAKIDLHLLIDGVSADECNYCGGSIDEGFFDLLIDFTGSYICLPCLSKNKKLLDAAILGNNLSYFHPKPAGHFDRDSGEPFKWICLVNVPDAPRLPMSRALAIWSDKLVPALLASALAKTYKDEY
jgi:hypothetical protein